LASLRRVSGPARIFLSALALDIAGAKYGTHHLKDHFEASLAAKTATMRQRIRNERKSS